MAAAAVAMLALTAAAAALPGPRRLPRPITATAPPRGLLCPLSRQRGVVAEHAGRHLPLDCHGRYALPERGDPGTGSVVPITVLCARSRLLCARSRTSCGDPGSSVPCRLASRSTRDSVSRRSTISRLPRLMISLESLSTLTWASCDTRPTVGDGWRAMRLLLRPRPEWSRGRKGRQFPTTLPL